MTNSEKMKVMDDNQLVAFLLENFGCNKIIDSACQYCDQKDNCSDEECSVTDEEIMMKWLTGGKSMSILLSDSEIEDMKKVAVTNFAVAVLAEVTECAKQEDSPLYEGDKEVDYFVRLSDVNEAINQYLNEPTN